MAQVNCPKGYNYWQILYSAGIQPDIETDRYIYYSETEILQADVTQEDLNNALAKYNHQAWLKELELINNPKIAEQQRITDLELAMAQILGGGI